ncbi:CoA ester lyase [Nocardioides nanhaiensis]|uniref:CoA ester lyase n=1 Tax=Nocardioides nanhaiensis TaxID=1476871 RepID=A0ABP8WDC8_9ACTN
MAESVLRPARSYLYVPGDRPDRFSSAAASGADAVVLDLEDGVGPAGKKLAHEAVRDHQRVAGCQWWVRVDSACLEDGVRSAVRPGTHGVLLPGAEPDLLTELDELLGDAETSAGVPPLAVVGLLETPLGVAEARAVARSRRVHRLGIGEADLSAALGMVPSGDRHELWAIRSDVVVASALAAIAPPVGPVQTDLDDEQLLRSSTEQLVRQGFAARTLIHPRQVGPVHEALAPTPRQVDEARSVIASFEEAGSAGAGVAVDPRGRLVDLAVVRSARAVLRRAGEG